MGLQTISGLEDCGKISLWIPLGFILFFGKNLTARINDTPEDMFRIVSGRKLLKILAL